MKLSEQLRGYFDPAGNSGRLMREINEAAALLDECEREINAVLQVMENIYAGPLPQHNRAALRNTLAKLRGEEKA